MYCRYFYTRTKLNRVARAVERSNVHLFNFEIVGWPLRQVKSRAVWTLVKRSVDHEVFDDVGEGALIPGEQVSVEAP